MSWRNACFAALGGAWLLGANAAASFAADSEVLRIGVLGDHSSAYSGLGGKYIVEMVKMAVEDFGGKSLGKQIEIRFEDTQLKADMASDIARRWLNEGVDVIVDLPTSNIVFTVTPLAEQYNKILLVTTAGSSDISGSKCSPNIAHWNFDSYSVAHTSPSILLDKGADTWFFVNTDSVTGTAIERDVTEIVKRKGGRVVGSVRTPADTSDFSSYLLQADASKAKVIAFVPAGSAGVSVVKQAVEFGLKRNGAEFIGLFMMPDDVKALGLETAQGLVYAAAFDPSHDAASKAFSDRFIKRMGKVPNMNMVASYSAVLHYLKAVQSVGSKDTGKVMAKMREVPVRDVFTSDGHLRIDGRMAHSMFAVQVKTPAESAGEWDLTKIIGTVSSDVAVRPLNAGGCRLVGSN